MFDYLVFIGRFQPFHLAHKAVIDEAFRHSSNVILLLGSAQPERTLKNVFTAEEREQMMRAAYPAELQQHIHFAGLIDVFNDVKWTQMAKDAVAQIVSDPAKKVGLIGHFKDQSSYYLRLFPEWPLVELDNFYQMSATPIRERYLLGQLPTLDEVPATTLAFLTAFQQTIHYSQLHDAAIEAYRI